VPDLEVVADDRDPIDGARHLRRLFLRLGVVHEAAELDHAAEGLDIDLAGLGDRIVAQCQFHLARGAGIGPGTPVQAMCHRAGERTPSRRIDDGTTPAAVAYQSLGNAV